MAMWLHALLLVRAVTRKIPMPWFVWVISVVVGWEAVRNARYVPFFMVGAFPFAVESAFQGWPSMTRAWRQTSYEIYAGITLAVFAILQLPHVGFRSLPNTVPVGVCDFVAAHHMHNRFYVDFDFGSYWVWRFAGSPAVFVDGRSPTVQGYADLRREIRLAREGPPSGWERFLEKYGITAVVVRNPPPQIRDWVIQSYFPKDKWSLQYRDELTLLFLKQNYPPRSS
jgi:hypothetical protein